jgi:hypothetical protein
VDLVVGYVLTAPSEFVKEETGAETCLFPGLLDQRLLFSTQARLWPPIWIQSRYHPCFAMRLDQLLHTALRYPVDRSSFLHGEKAGTYTDYEPFDLLIRQFYHAIRRHVLAK